MSITAAPTEANKGHGTASSKRKLPLWLWLLKHSQAIVTTGLSAGVVYYHNAHVVYLVCTSLATSFLAKGLKLVVKQPRPPGSVVQTPGMPSTHSATGTFFALYLAAILARHEALDPSWLEPLRLGLVPTLVVFPALMMYSRVRLGVHSTAQCVVGGLIGCMTTVVFSKLWYGSYPLSPSSSVSTGLRHASIALRFDSIVQETLHRLIPSTYGF